MSPTFTNYQPDAIAVSAATHCSTIQHTATHCNNTSILYETPLLPLRDPVFTDNQQGNCSHCNNTLQHTLQHTATTCTIASKTPLLASAWAYAQRPINENYIYRTPARHYCCLFGKKLQHDTTYCNMYSQITSKATAATATTHCNTHYSTLQHDTTYCNMYSQITSKATAATATTHCNTH